ncbi:MAG: hypothetical protein AABY68_13080 [Pseudomonadota bacterium]
MRILPGLTAFTLLASMQAAADSYTKISFSVPVNGINSDNGVYALYSYATAKPKLIKVALNPIPVNDKNKEELLYIDGDLIFPAFSSSDYKPGKPTSCYTLLFKVAINAGGRGYSPCRSNLTKATSYELGTNIVMTVMMVGINALVGSFAYSVEINEEEVLKVTKDAQEISRIKQDAAAKIKEKNYLVYRNDYNNAKSSGSINRFINKYEGSDPDGLVGNLKAMLPMALAKDEERKIIMLAEQRRIEAYMKEKFVHTVNVSTSIGKKVCVSTMLEYEAIKAPNVLGSVPELVKEPGQIFGTIDDYQINNGKIKILIGGWSTPTGRLSYYPSTLYVRGYGVVVNPGTYAWTDIGDWWYC